MSISTQKHLNMVSMSNNLQFPLRVYGACQDFNNLPEYQGDFLPHTLTFIHFDVWTGYYSLCPNIKKSTRESEYLLRTETEVSLMWAPSWAGWKKNIALQDKLLETSREVTLFSNTTIASLVAHT
jgi:hypothetical protein